MQKMLTLLKPACQIHHQFQMTDFDFENTVSTFHARYLGLHLCEIICDSQQFKQYAVYKH